MYKAIFIDRISEYGKGFPSSITDGDNYFTIGWGGISARKFKEFNSDFIVECWKTDQKAKQIYTKEISGVLFKIYPAFHIKYFGDYSGRLLKDLKHELSKNEPTVVHITSFRHLLFYSIAAKLKDYPLVVQNNGESTSMYKIIISKGLKRLMYLFHLRLEEKAFINIDLLYILDERIKSFLPYNKAQIKKQTMGVLPERFTPLDKREAKQLLGLETDKRYFLYIGKLNYTKRPDILIDIYKEIKKVRNDIELLIAGTNPEDPLIHYAKSSGARVFGRIMHTDIYKFLSAADAYILPKYSKEHIFGGIGLLPVEALLCNTPVIGDSLKNFPEEFRNDVGLSVSDPEEMKNAILDIIDGKVVFNNLRDTAVKSYSWESIAKKTGEDFKVLIKKYYM